MYYWGNKNLSSIEYINDDGEKCLEKWRPIIGYEGFYEVSNLGRVKSLKRLALNNHPFPEKILHQRIGGRGYLRVTLRKNGSIWLPCVHKLVLSAFIPNPENKPQGNHKKGIKIDNRLWQLEWVTRSENAIHSFEVLGRKPTSPGRGKKGALHPSSRKVMCLNDSVVYDSILEASKGTGLSTASVGDICRGKYKPRRHNLNFKFV
jgi:hypothetical protein